MKYPIGIQTFQNIIEGDYIYVDKTDLVYKLVSEGVYYFLSRPRRFGKSLLTTTFEAYFQGKRELFRGLAIDSLEKDWTEYPVFHIDFSAADYTDPNMIGERMNFLLHQWERQYGKGEAENTLGDRFYGVISRAREKTGRQVVILIDEYDKPLTDTIGLMDVQDKNRAALQSIYGIMKRADQHIRFAFITGVTRYGKLGIFSAANNPMDISLNKTYASVCGITESELYKYFDKEVESFAEIEGCAKEEMYSILKNRYDGYHFQQYSEDIYNPFSLLNALNSKEIQNYWFATGTPTYLTNILKKRFYDLSKFSNGIEATAETIASFGNGEGNIIAALYQSGYLTIKDYNKESESYMLGFPNEEVTNGFVKYLLKDFLNKEMYEFDADFLRLRRLIMADDTQAFMSQIQYIIGQVPFESNEVKQLEANFRNMIYLMIRFSGYNVFVEHPVLGGRIDVFFETSKRIYVIECKRNQTAKDALAQIDMKKYAERISSQDKPVVKIGVNFSTDEKNITEWKIVE